MKIKPQFVWIGTAALGAAFFMATMQGPHDEQAAPKAAEPDLFPFVRSLEGTRPDGDIKVAADDTLVVDAELGRLFDYYLSTVGEQSIDAIRAEIERELDRRLKPGPAGEAKHLLARYLDYKRALLELEQNMQLQGAAADAIRRRFNAMQQMRARFFSDEENQGLFGFDDAYDMDAMARIDIGQNQSLSEQKRKEKLAAIDARMPPALREARDAPLQIVRLEESMNQMRSQGASEDDIYRARAAVLTPEAAGRLAQVDQEELAWKNRITVYLAERGKLVDRMSGAERESALLQLRQARFSPDEQRRLAAYE